VNFILPENNSVQTAHAEILNALGQTVLVTEPLTPETNDGNSIVTINTADLPAGIYIVMMYSEDKLIGVSKFVAE
jgi:hypothetical protein